MSRTTPARAWERGPGRIAGPTRRAVPAGRLGRREALLLAACVLAVLGVGVWGVAQQLGRIPGTGPGVVQVPGGLMRIERVAPYDPAALHAAMQGDKGFKAVMPGMPAFMDPDPVPEGKRRFSVRVVLTAVAAQGLRVERSSFSVSGEGVVPTVPRGDQLGVSTVPRGATTNGELTFEVPAAAHSLSLSFAGGEESLPIELPEAPPPVPSTK